MARHSFGGGIADYVVTQGESGELKLAPNVAVTFWSAATGGAQITGLLDTTGTAIPNDAVLSDASGAIPAFGTAPDGIRAMWASASLDGSGARRLITATDLGAEVGDVATRLAALEARLSGVGRLTASPTAPANPGTGDVWFDTSAPTGGNPIAFRAANGVFTAASTVTCALPAGLVPGDYLVAVVVFASGAGELLSAQPDGWTILQASQQFGGDTRIAIYGRVYAAGDTAPSWSFATATQTSVTARVSAGIVAYANAASTPQVGTYAIRSGTGNNSDAPSITTAVPDALVLSIFGEKSPGVPTSVTDPAGTTRRLYQTGTGTSLVPSVLVCDFAQPVAGPSGVRTASFQPASDNGFGVQIGLTRRQN
ncbi:hypothetical protein [Actinomadura rayongensis]|uniref:Uncharacterized protein n=1 Tax=Actinomadura rayongensis TaxID=1429076 RepID=A0A6I4WA76_9ACTN|nr:hypothetical protein [Actinomadura rayongensis]MXQ63964.1 hypothetical protein [Actinomadura rayongensis]